MHSLKYSIRMLEVWAKRYKETEEERMNNCGRREGKFSEELALSLLFLSINSWLDADYWMLNGQRVQGPGSVKENRGGVEFGEAGMMKGGPENVPKARLFRTSSFGKWFGLFLWALI